jgi:hypothetical protein
MPVPDDAIRVALQAAQLKKPLSEEGIVAAVADAAAKRICRRTIRHFQAIKAELSGDDSGLATVWDEICVQFQDESSILWEFYDADVRLVVLKFRQLYT